MDIFHHGHSDIAQNQCCRVAGQYVPESRLQAPVYHIPLCLAYTSLPLVTATLSLTRLDLFRYDLFPRELQAAAHHLVVSASAHQGGEKPGWK